MLTRNNLQRAEIDPPTILPTRLQALDVCKRYASAIGLKAAKIALIDQLFAFTSPKDWEEQSQLKIVWPTNDLLARRLGISVSTLKYHLAGLVEAMLIQYSDHPTYQRRGYRDGDGRIVEGYGIDLSPISIRYPHMLEVATNFERNARDIKKLSYQRTSLRRQIEATIRRAYDQGPEAIEVWQDLHVRLSEACSIKIRCVGSATEIVALLEVILREASERLEVLLGMEEIATALPKIRPLQTTEELPDIVVCSERRCADAQQDLFEVACGEAAYEGLGAIRPAATTEIAEAVGVRPDLMFTVSSLSQCMPQLFQMVPQIFDDSREFLAGWQPICALCHINPQVFHQARSILGNAKAALALAITAERYAAGLVENPGGYLRAMLDRACDGKLHLDRSLHAMMHQTIESRRRYPGRDAKDNTRTLDVLSLSSSPPSQ